MVESNVTIALIIKKTNGEWVPVTGNIDRFIITNEVTNEEDKIFINNLKQIKTQEKLNKYLDDLNSGLNVIQDKLNVIKGSKSKIKSKPKKERKPSSEIKITRGAPTSKIIKPSEYFKQQDAELKKTGFVRQKLSFVKQLAMSTKFDNYKEINTICKINQQHHLLYIIKFIVDLYENDNGCILFDDDKFYIYMLFIVQMLTMNDKIGECIKKLEKRNDGKYVQRLWCIYNLLYFKIQLLQISDILCPFIKGTHDNLKNKILKNLVVYDRVKKCTDVFLDFLNCYEKYPEDIEEDTKKIYRAEPDGIFEEIQKLNSSFDNTKI